MAETTGSLFLIEENPAKSVAMGTFRDLLKLSPFTSSCQEYLLDLAESAYVYSLRVSDVLANLNLTFSDRNLGTFDPAQAHQNEKAYLEHAISVAEPTVDIDDEETVNLREEQMAQIGRWIPTFEERYHDNLFDDLVKP